MYTKFIATAAKTKKVSGVANEAPSRRTKEERPPSAEEHEHGDGDINEYGILIRT